MPKSFKPAFGLKNKHLQTLYSSLFRKDLKLNFEIEIFEFDDKDFVDCYWYNKQNDKDIVVLFHGLAGSFKSPYIQGTMKTLSENGFSPVLMHFRGCSGRDNKLPRAYHSGDTNDALSFLKSIKKRFPNSKIFAIGYSLGGNMLLKLLGELKENKLIEKAISVSAPLQLDISANKMNKGLSKFYQAYLLKDLKQQLKKKYNQHDMQSLIKLNKQEIKTLRNFWQFDDVYTAKIHGYESASDYYKKSSAKQYLKDIQTQTLIIHALDDPFMTPEILPSKNGLSKNIILEIYPNGGHVGFIGGTIFRPIYWLEKRIIDFLKN